MLTSSLVALVMAAVTIARPMPYQVPRHLSHLTVQKRAADFGSCSNPTIIFANGLDGRKEASFGPANNADFNHGSALNIGIIANFICQRLDSSCKANQEAKDACAAAVSAATGQKGQAAADAFNAAISSGAVSSGRGAVAARAPAATVQKRAVDFGSCSNPTIIFADGLDGRKEASFGPANNADFNHGSALNIGIIANFICQRLDSSCKANQEAKDACAAAVSAATGQKGQAAADAFNAAISGGAASSGGGAVAAAAPAVNVVNPVVSNVGASNVNVGASNVFNSNDIAAQLAAAQIAQLAAANQQCVQQIVTVTVTAGAAAAAPTAAANVASNVVMAFADSADQEAAAAAAAVTAAPQVAGGVQAAGNRQTFTGALGGVSAPAVVVGGKGFVVNGSDFLNIGAALGRSCDVQKNQCANLANGGNSNFSVTDCDAQNAACRAQI